MRKITKHLVCQGKNVVELPEGARVLAVVDEPCKTTSSSSACIIVMADENRHPEKRTFVGVATGEAADHVAGSSCEHVGSCDDLHVFEEKGYSQWGGR